MKPGVPVSVVMPCFRSGKTIAAAIASVDEQSIRALEVIVVDDASDDETPRELARLALRYGDAWMRTIALSCNAGPATARNIGWHAAKGDFVAFLDADDTWDPRKLELQYAIMQGDPGIALSGTRHTFGKPAPVGSAAQPRLTEISRQALLWRNRFTPSTVMARRELQVRFREGQRHMEDHRAWLDVAFSGHRIVLIDLPLATQSKPAYGASGQSADLVAMERAELENYRQLWRDGRISTMLLAALWMWSAAKFLRRIGVIALRGLSG